MVLGFCRAGERSLSDGVLSWGICPYPSKYCCSSTLFLSHHGRYFSVGLQVLDNLALVCRLDACKQSRVPRGLGLVVGAQIVELTAGECLALGALGFTEHADTTTDRLGRRLSKNKQIHLRSDHIKHAIKLKTSPVHKQTISLSGFE